MAGLFGYGKEYRVTAGTQAAEEPGSHSDHALRHVAPAYSSSLEYSRAEASNAIDTQACADRLPVWATKILWPIMSRGSQQQLAQMATFAARHAHLLEPTVDLPQPSFVRTKLRLPQSMDVKLIVGRGDLAAPTNQAASS
ncbi:hypothetical protein COCMIDRAFT_8598 [Bipolaris oryzae ATCC 44560]|uniref:Uncharacterized protein n=1 Tax=Bipolaris oryzae ATCC 44560 TaxID=930090 RepID=W6ZDX8_COCMI|nr:uncharacterized protein COCMIDRAFT_8598 [Bipolaris oryzae ATCC 44560]EUC41716.1 hypothetical protein COCMIDRAFT_8598 [Bipolaris oryzae ATCC 44560]